MSYRFYAVGWIKVLGGFCPGKRSESTFNFNGIYIWIFSVDSA